jgi:hypothetical protein
VPQGINVTLLGVSIAVTLICGSIGGALGSVPAGFLAALFIIAGILIFFGDGSD